MPTRTKRDSFHVVKCACLISGFIAFPLGSQQSTLPTQTTPIPCRRCEIGLEKIATIGMADDPELLSERSQLTMNSTGQFIATSGLKNTVLVFDRAGRYQQKISRSGHGPGELYNVYATMVGPGDSIWIMNGPASLVFSPTFEYVRTSRRPNPNWGSARPLIDGSLVTASATPLDADHFLFLSKPDGKVVRAFDEGRAQYQAASGIPTSCNACLVPALTPARQSGAFWSLNLHNYRLRLWSADVSVLDDFTIKSPAFRPFADDNRGNPSTQRERPLLRELAVDESGLLIVAGETSSARWISAGVSLKSSVRKGQPITSKEERTREILRQNRATLLQVVDPKTRSIIAERQFDGQQLYLIPGGYVYAHRTDSDGFVFLDVWRLRLRRIGAP